MADINFKSLLAFLLLSVLFSSCGEEEPIGDKLSAAELLYLRTRAAAKCAAESDVAFQIVTDNSLSSILSHDRNERWNLTYKIKTDNGSYTNVQTDTLYVWKRTATHVYYRLKETTGGDETNKFYKIPIDFNDDMIRAIQTQECNKSFTVSKASTQLSTTIKEARIVLNATTKTETHNQYRVRTLLPAFFGKKDLLKTKFTYNEKDVLQKTEYFDWTFSVSSDTDLQPASYTDGSILKRTYCVVEYSDPSASSYKTYAYPYVERCTNLTDGDSPSLDANLGAGSDLFTPATEL